MIAGNLSNSKEMQNLIQQYPNQKFPLDIPDHNKTAFNFVGVRIKFDGLTPNLQVHQFCVSSQQYYSYREDMKTALIQQNYNSVIMIHNPELKMIEEVAPKESKKAKRVTPPVKKKIEEMAADGMSADVIAEDLELSVEQVEKYL
jgi:uncharacterized protein YciW